MYLHVSLFSLLENSITGHCSDKSQKDTEVYLWNSGFPSTGIDASTSCTCSVAASCDTKIQIYALDMRLDTGCQQKIEILDDGTTTTFDCNNNIEYITALLYTSSSHFIKVTVTNPLNAADGFFFFQFKGNSSKHIDDSLQFLQNIHNEEALTDKT